MISDPKVGENREGRIMKSLARTLLSRDVLESRPWIDECGLSERCFMPGFSRAVDAPRSVTARQVGKSFGLDGGVENTEGHQLFFRIAKRTS